MDIVFLHANGFNARTYRAILAPLGARFRVLAIDQRGHGQTSLPADPGNRPGWDDLTEDLLALLEQEDLRDVVLAGHSMGGTVGLLAARGSDRVRNLVLLDPVIIPLTFKSGPGALSESALKRRATFPSRGSVVEAYRGRGAFRTWPLEILQDYVADGFALRGDGQVELACTPAWEASNFAAQSNDTWRALREVAVPIEIFKAEHGSPCRIEGREEELAASGWVRLRTVLGTSHFLPMEQPDLVRRVLRTAAG